MIVVQDIYLVIRNARDKIQTARFVLNQEGSKYIIQRFTGQFSGKITTQPEKIIEKGKAKRSVLQQAELEYNALVKKAMDKGYKKLSALTKTKPDDITASELDKIVPSIKTDANGNIKPQNAKSSKECTPNAFEKGVFCSRKLDGVRCLFKYDKDLDAIKTVSRGGGDYDVATLELRLDDRLLEFFRENPDIILDGELYIHGWSLQKISGTARLKTYDEERCSHLEYWIYDIVDITKTFNERLDFLQDLEIEMKNHEKIKVLDHVWTVGWNSVKRLHDKFVLEGFEGLVARKADKKYAPGRRPSDWIKVKDYQDDEFEIVGIEEKDRDEDMVFVLKTKEGKTFNAKPMGDRALKAEYLEIWPTLVGKMATVKYFTMYEGVPQQPTFKSVRESGE